ncbi:MAG TPA: CHRD domain-containing protein [Thermoanaerobaculia bacterium]|nr:CHRD domain-containing protein [Thermoanaerobaculia bacterium]
MKRIAILLALLAMPIVASAQSYSALLHGANEAPGPGDTDGVGFGVVTLDGTTLRYSVWTQNIGAATQAHIHTGIAGVAGDVLVPLNVNTLTNGTATITAEQATAIKANPSGFYINVHNAEFPNGAVRGQLAATTSGEGTMTSYIPVVGKVAGQNNTNFVTDLRIVNNGGAAANVTLDYFAQSGAGQSNPTATKTLTVAPGEQKVLDDVVGATLAVTSGLGGLRITSDQNVVASARVINDLRTTGLGTAGFAVDADQQADNAGVISFLSSNTDYRTNVGYFNPRSTSVTATFVARRSSDGAVLGTNTLTIPGYAMVQQGAFDLISSVAGGDRTQNNYYITWTANAPLFVYGAVTDNKTGDAVLNQ